MILWGLPNCCLIVMWRGSCETQPDTTHAHRHAGKIMPHNGFHTAASQPQWRISCESQTRYHTQIKKDNVLHVSHADYCLRATVTQILWKPNPIPYTNQKRYCLARISYWLLPQSHSNTGPVKANLEARTLTGWKNNTLHGSHIAYCLKTTTTQTLWTPMRDQTH